MTISSLPLFAATRVDELLMPYREPVVESPGLPVYVWVIGGLVAVAIGYFLFRQFGDKSHVVTPDALLKELCYAHRIGITERQLLGLVAEKASIDNPATMFITTKNFDQAVAKANQEKKFSRRDQSSLKTVRNQLFSLGY